MVTQSNIINGDSPKQNISLKEEFYPSIGEYSFLYQLTPSFKSTKIFDNSAINHRKHLTFLHIHSNALRSTPCHTKTLSDSLWFLAKRLASWLTEEPRTHTAGKVELGEDAVSSLDGHVNVLVRCPDCVHPHLQPHQVEDMSISEKLMKQTKSKSLSSPSRMSSRCVEAGSPMNSQSCLVWEATADNLPWGPV